MSGFHANVVVRNVSLARVRSVVADLGHTAHLWPREPIVVVFDDVVDGVGDPDPLLAGLTAEGGAGLVGSVHDDHVLGIEAWHDGHLVLDGFVPDAVDAAAVGRLAHAFEVGSAAVQLAVEGRHGPAGRLYGRLLSALGAPPAAASWGFHALLEAGEAHFPNWPELEPAGRLSAL